MMKNFFWIIPIFFFGTAAYAQSKCYDFTVGMYSTDLTKVRVQIPNQLTDKSFKAVMLGTTGHKSITTPFTCTHKDRNSQCSQDAGGGDFSLSIEGVIVKMTFSYINLAIGATGPNAAKPGVELDEEFALLNTSATSDEEDADDAGHVEEMTLSGRLVPCEDKL